MIRGSIEPLTGSELVPCQATLTSCGLTRHTPLYPSPVCSTAGRPSSGFFLLLVEPDPKVWLDEGDDVCTQPVFAATAEVDDLTVSYLEGSFGAEMPF